MEEKESLFFVVTIRECVQIGPDDWKMKDVSKVFNEHTSMKDILEWAKSTGFKSPDVSDLKFSVYDK